VPRALRLKFRFENAQSGGPQCTKRADVPIPDLEVYFAFNCRKPSTGPTSCAGAPFRGP
jgi:hypothetical protein